MKICTSCAGLGAHMDRAGWYRCKRCGGLGTTGLRSKLQLARAAADWKLRSTLAVGRYVAFGDCGYFCKQDETYGFVPEAECPVHDPGSDWQWRVSQLAMRIRPLVIDTGNASG